MIIERFCALFIALQLQLLMICVHVAQTEILGYNAV